MSTCTRAPAARRLLRPLGLWGAGLLLSSCQLLNSLPIPGGLQNLAPPSVNNFVQSARTGNVGGNVNGSVATVNALAANSITAAAAAADFGTEVGTAVWATATRELTAGTNIVLAKGVGVTGFNDLDAAGVRGAVGLASANLDTQIGTLATVALQNPLNKTTSLEELLNAREYDRIVDHVIELEDLRRQIVRAVLQNPSVVQLISDLIYHGVKSYLVDENALTKKVPGMSSLMKMGKGVMERMGSLDAALENTLKSKATVPVPNFESFVKALY